MGGADGTYRDAPGGKLEGFHNFVAGAADRLTHHVHILEMNGDSYRLKQSKRRPRTARAADLPDSPPEQ